MRWILAFMFLLLPLSVNAALISYQVEGVVEELSGEGSDSVKVQFIVNTETWSWVSLGVELWGRLWTPTDSSNRQISIWSREPEGGPTHWFNWTPTPLMMSEDQVMASLRAITTPTLFVRADSGLLANHGGLDERGQAIANLKIAHVPGGHHCHLDGDTRPVSEAIKHFLSDE